MYFKKLVSVITRSSSFSGKVNIKPVDIVITWVNSTDSQYMQDRQQHYQEGDNSTWRIPDVRNNELELKTAILCIIKNIDWKGTIFIVTPYKQVPRCYHQLKKIYSSIQVVFQEQIWPKHLQQTLPAFNSLAVEANLHRIPKLSEKFIYFNDDMYVTKKLDYCSVFDRGKMVVQPLTFIPTRARKLNVYSYIWRNMLDTYVMYPPWYGFYALTKTAMSATEKYMKNQWEQTISSRFRSKTDIHPVGATLSWAMNNGQGVLAFNPLVLDEFHDRGSVWNDRKVYHDVVCINYTSDLPRSINHLRASVGELPNIESY